MNRKESFTDDSSFQDDTIESSQHNNEARAALCSRAGWQMASRNRSSLRIDGSHEFRFDDISFSVPDSQGKGTKQIINHATGTVSAGNLMAIMGPSGAGKTTLLKVLMLQAFEGHSTGTVKLDGKDMTFKRFKEQCGFMEQEDTLWPHLTTRDHLEYAANLVLCDTKEEKKEKISELLDLLGLTVASNTRAASLSGGQKRRLSLALAMIKSPLLLLLDEPTSGLDAAAAEAVIDAMALLAATTRVMILCTIHQPPTEVFFKVSHLTLLSRGRLVYTGRASNAVPYFESMGHALPNNTNPADHFLRVINAEFTDPEQVHDLIQAWEEKQAAIAGDMEGRMTTSMKEFSKKQHPSFSSRFIILLKRHMKLSFLDPAIYTGRMVAFLILGLIISTVYIKVRDRTLDMALERVIMVGWFLAVPSMLTIVHVFQTNVEMKTITKEVRLGCVCPVNYMMAKFVIEIPFMFLLSLVTLGVSGFGMVNFNTENFILIIVLFSCLLLAFEALAQTAAMVFKKAEFSMLLYVLVWFTAFLFSGIWIAEEDVFVPFRLLFYISPLRLAFRAFAYLDFHGTTFSCGEGLWIFSSTECVGDYSGDKVLDLMGYIFPVLTSETNVSWCIGVTLIIALTFKMCYAIRMITSVERHSMIVGTDQPTQGCLFACNKRQLFVFFLLASLAGFITGMSIWMANDNETIGAEKCLSALKSSGFDLEDFGNYDKFFNETTVMTLAEAGSYHGAEGIREYVRFLVGTSSPYFSDYSLPRLDTDFIEYNKETASCSFRQFALAEYVPDGTTTNIEVSKFQTTTMGKLHLDYESKKVSTVNVFYDKDFLSFFFEKLLHSDTTRNFVCSVMNGPCNMVVDNCEEALSNLPLTTEDMYFDGNSQGCRALHAVFARLNSKHCAHISLDPMADEDGEMKCQQSREVLPEDLFDQDDFTMYANFQAEVGIMPGVGFIWR